METLFKLSDYLLERERGNKYKYKWVKIKYTNGILEHTTTGYVCETTSEKIFYLHTEPYGRNDIRFYIEWNTIKSIEVIS